MELGGPSSKKERDQVIGQLVIVPKKPVIEIRMTMSERKGESGAWLTKEDIEVYLGQTQKGKWGTLRKSIGDFKGGPFLKST